MRKDPRTFLEHILESIRLAKDYASGLSREALSESRQAQDAIVRRIEIIGEAVKNLPQEIKTRHPEVPSSEMARMRDILIHAYFAIDLDEVWAVVRRDLPGLEKKIAAILAELD